MHSDYMPQHSSKSACFLPQSLLEWLAHSLKKTMYFDSHSSCEFWKHTLTFCAVEYRLNWRVTICALESTISAFWSQWCKLLSKLWKWARYFLDMWTGGRGLFCESVWSSLWLGSLTLAVVAVWGHQAYHGTGLKSAAHTEATRVAADSHVRYRGCVHGFQWPCDFVPSHLDRCFGAQSASTATHFQFQPK